MTLTLDSFESGSPSLELSKFKEAIPSGLKIGRKAASQIAATRSLLVHQTADEYRQTREMLLDPSTRGNYAVEQTALREELYKRTVNGLDELAADQQISLDERIALVEGAGAGPQSFFLGKTPNLDMLAEESLVAPSGEDESAASAQMRLNFADSIEQVNSRKRRVSNAINSLELAREQGLAGKAVDMAELFAPLAEWVHVDRLFNDARDYLGEDSEQAVLMGSQREALTDAIRSLPSSEREAFSRAMIDLVQEHENVILPDGNDMLSVDALERMLLDGEYTNFEKWFDNATSVLDVLFVGGLVRGIGKGGTRAATGGRKAASASDVFEGEIVSGGEIVPRGVNSNQVEDIFDLDSSQWTEVPDVNRVARTEATRTEVVPSSPSQVVKDTNPNMAREMHRMAADDATEEAAEALYGSSRQEALAKDLLPEPGITPGRAPNKVEMNMGPVFKEPENLKSTRKHESNLAVSRQELGRVFESLTERLRMQTSNLVVRTSDEGKMAVTARYNPPDAGFSSYDDAITEAEYAFRNYGMTEDNFTVYRRDGDSWAAIDRKQAADMPEGTPYSIGVDWEYNFRPEDLEEVDLLKTGNFLSRALDRMPTQFAAQAGQGSIVQNILDAASTIHPQLVGAASVASDRTVRLQKLYVQSLEDFTGVYKKLPKDRRAAVTGYINEANFEGIPFSKTDLYARGFSQDEVKALKTWRQTNDALWHAVNEDLVKTLRGKGYVSLIHKDSDTRLIGRPASRTTVTSRDGLFDPATGKNVNLTPAEIDELYENGGSIIRFDEAIEVDGQWIEYAVNHNTPSGGFVRQLYDGETVLRYRDGYYPVAYDANYFIYREITKSNGTKGRKVVGTANTKKEAQEASARIAAQDPDAVVDFKKDRRFGEERNKIGEDNWSMVVSSGMSSQRVRGQRLEDLSSNLEKSAHSNLKDPLEAMRAQIAQVSNNAPMRQVLDTMKKRWMLNYGKYLDLPLNETTKEIQFPNSVSAIKNNNKLDSGFVADARTNYNYIYSLENGYINGMDEVYRAALHLAADAFAEVKLPFLEKFLLNTTALSPIQSAKTAAFKLFLSLNPVRQAVIQRGQIIMLGVIDAAYASTGLISDLFKINYARVPGAKVAPETRKLMDEVEESGILDAVDAHNYIRQDLGRLADLSASEKFRAGVAKPVDFLQEVGFNSAERDNLLAAWLTIRQRAVKEGKDLSSQRVKDEILAETRSFTLQMNRAGEQPYGQNTLGIAAQFFSFPHKALLQGATNKSLTPMRRAQLLAYSLVMFGGSASLLRPALDWAMEGMEPSETRDAIEDGLIHTMLNMAATEITGEQQAVDWGDFAPVEAYGMGNTIVGMFSTDLGEIISNSPAGSLLFGANPRVSNAFKTAMRYFNVMDDYDDPALETSLYDVVTSFASLASGYSNAFKARYAYQTRQKMSSSGRITDQEITAFEAFMANFGFQTETESGYREVNEVIYGSGSFEATDVQQWYTDVRAQLSRRGQSVSEIEHAQRVASEAWRVFGDDRPKAAREIVRMLERDAASNDFRMFNGIIRAMGLRPQDEIWDMINAMPNNVYRERLTTLMQGANN